MLVAGQLYPLGDALAALLGWQDSHHNGLPSAS